MDKIHMGRWCIRNGRITGKDAKSLGEDQKERKLFHFLERFYILDVLYTIHLCYFCFWCLEPKESGCSGTLCVGAWNWGEKERTLFYWDDPRPRFVSLLLSIFTSIFHPLTFLFYPVLTDTQADSRASEPLPESWQEREEEERPNDKFWGAIWAGLLTCSFNTRKNRRRRMTKNRK